MNLEVRDSRLAFDPSGICLGVILTPEVAANFTFGHYRSLFITASTSLYRTRVEIPVCRSSSQRQAGIVRLNSGG